MPGKTSLSGYYICSSENGLVSSFLKDGSQIYGECLFDDKTESVYETEVDKLY